MARKQENLREKIVDASISLFLTKGFAGATTRELTDAAGVSKGTLYWYFESKEQILEEILERISRELYDEAIEKAKGSRGDFVARFRMFYRFITEFAREKKELLLVSSTVLGEIAGKGNRLEKKMRSIQMKLHDFIRTLLDEGQQEGSVDRGLDTDVQAHIILANLIGMHIQWCLHGASFDAVAYARAYREQIMRGLGIRR